MTIPMEDLKAMARHLQQTPAEVTEKGIRPFSNGSEYDTWDYNMCQRCAKGYKAMDGSPLPDDTPDCLCDIQRAIFESMASGYITPEIARRAGLDTVLPTGCTEFEGQR